MTVELPGGVPGIDVPRLAAWLSGAVPDAGRISGIELIAGGRSNLTYRLDLTGGGVGRHVVVRRPPLGHVLPTAHDMGREHRVLSALAGSAVPVPRPLAMCADEDVIGAPFYVMEYVEGRVLRTVEDAADVPAEQARAISEQLMDVLADIHLLDVDAAGLADFGRPEGYLARQLRRWGKQWEASHAAHLHALAESAHAAPDGQVAAAPGTATSGATAPGAATSGAATSGATAPGAATRDVVAYAADYDRLFARLAERLPEGRPPAPAGRSAGGTLVHGDFRLDNALVRLGPAPAIAAVVDWEMSTLGDPLADLGLTLVYWTESDDEERLSIPVGSTVTAAPGFGTGREFAERYAARTGFDLADLDYYVAFGCFKLAVVLEGIHARFLQNATVGEGFDQVGESVPILVERAHRILDARSSWPGRA
ncbi:MAG TPA: phosphotransferase family protein [Streptosporangiaceae bacterium]|jgi:aminoglycoside phosphotransferase (APT) family kinase protein|nr:phosphotransferase family protein [Streptosporangiaceae bacterium]